MKISSILLLVSLFSLSCQQSPSPASQLTTPPGGSDTLSVALAQRYVSNYAKRAGMVPEYGDGTRTVDTRTPDTRCVWFSVKQLETLLKQVRKEGGDGIRFYFAAYDRFYERGFNAGYVPDTAYWNHNTLIMTSTFDTLVNEQLCHWDYYNYVRNKRAMHGFIIHAAPQNRGEICPPPANCYAIGARLIVE